MKMKLLLMLQGMLTAFCLGVHGQDTLRLKIEDTENLFLNRNLQLLIQKYSIDSARAMIIQARLYNNPYLSFTGDLYNPKERKIFDVSNATGEYSIGIQQLILLAGKRNKQIKLAETGAVLSEQSFYDLLRTLRYILRSDFYNIFFLQNSFNNYGLLISTLTSLSNAYDTLQKKGYVTLKDAVRIKSLLYSMRAEQTNLLNQINSVESELKLLLQNNKSYIVPVADRTPVAMRDLHQLKLQDLIDTAYANRYDLKSAQTKVLYNQQNYRLQKANAVPDLTLGAAFDKRGSFTENASFFNFGINLPFFNRNQGNIKASKLAISQSEVNLNFQRQAVENQVQTAFNKALNTDTMLKTFDPNFRDQFDQLLQAITLNFQKRNISLLEFTDFYQSYKENMIQLNQLQYQRMQAVEDLHFAIGKTLINY